MAAVNVNIPDILSGVEPIIDKLFTTEADRAEARFKVLELAQAGQLQQMEVNKQEAKHKSRFVSGWRPFIGWVCGTAFAMNFVLFPVAEYAILYASYITGEQYPTDMPTMEWEYLMPVLLGMLGLGGMRSFEKSKGVARE